MVLNETALAGLPLLSTTAAGAAARADRGRRQRLPRAARRPPLALREALRRLVENEEFRRAAGARSQDIAARFTPEAWADTVARVADSARG